MKISRAAYERLMQKIGPLTDRDVLLVTVPKNVGETWVRTMAVRLRETFGAAGLKTPVFLVASDFKVELMSPERRRLMAAELLRGLTP